LEGLLGSGTTGNGSEIAAGRTKDDGRSTSYDDSCGQHSNLLYHTEDELVRDSSATSLTVIAISLVSI